MTEPDFLRYLEQELKISQDSSKYNISCTVGMEKVAHKFSYDVISWTRKEIFKRLKSIKNEKN